MSMGNMHGVVIGRVAAWVICTATDTTSMKTIIMGFCFPNLVLWEKLFCFRCAYFFLRYSLANNFYICHRQMLWRPIDGYVGHACLSARNYSILILMIISYLSLRWKTKNICFCGWHPMLYNIRPLKKRHDFGSMSCTTKSHGMKYEDVWKNT